MMPFVRFLFVWVWPTFLLATVAWLSLCAFVPAKPPRRRGW